MSILSIKTKTIRSIKDFEFRSDPEECSGWHGIIGDNGSGKSTVAKAVVLGLVGASEAPGLGEDWGNWLRKRCKKGGIELTFKDGNIDGQRTVGVCLEKSESKSVKPRELQGPRDSDKSENRREEQTVFSASCGPFRRFGGGAKDTKENCCLAERSFRV